MALARCRLENKAAEMFCCCCCCCCHSCNHTYLHSSPFWLCSLHRTHESGKQKIELHSHTHTHIEASYVEEQMNGECYSDLLAFSDVKNRSERRWRRKQHWKRCSVHIESIRWHSKEQTHTSWVNVVSIWKTEFDSVIAVDWRSAMNAVAQQSEGYRADLLWCVDSRRRLIFLHRRSSVAVGLIEEWLSGRDLRWWVDRLDWMWDTVADSVWRSHTERKDKCISVIDQFHWHAEGKHFFPVDRSVDTDQRRDD